MILIAMMTAALLAFVRQAWLFEKYRHYESRRGLSGCEIARQLLDQMGFPQISVQPVSGWDRFRMDGDKQLLLEEKYYRGHNLYAIAETARRAVLLSKSSGMVIPMNWLVRMRLALRILMIPAWLFVLAGTWNPGMGLLRQPGLFLLEAMLLLGIFELSREWDVGREAFELLKKTGAFESDEAVKLRGLLSALKLNGLAEIFRAPHEIISGLFRKRDSRGL